MRFIWRSVRFAVLWGLLGYALTVMAVVLFTIAKPVRATADFAPADVIVVLGAGMDPDGQLHSSTELRVARGVALWDAGVAPVMHMTGGTAVDRGPSAGAGMKALAISLGVPAEAITTEDASRSTLQNALFSQDALASANSAVLVTEGFHLPRAWASFRWAGGPNDLQLAVSTRFRWEAERPAITALRMIFREAAAWWFNLARAGAYGFGGLVGVNEGTRAAWLE